MKRAFIFALLLSILPMFASAQQPQRVHPKGKTVDGAVNPELIPEAVAYRLYLYSLTVSSTPSPEDVAKQSGFILKLQLTGIDQLRLLPILADFRSQYDTFVATFNEYATATQPRGEQVSDTTSSAVG